MIRVYNTQSRHKDDLVTIEPQKVKMYVCGPTTYNYIHLGNARPLVVFDTIRRYLTYRGYDVTYVQNFTDVDDKIINRAAEEGIEAKDLAERYIDEYFKDAEALGILPAALNPRVSEHIPDIITVIDGLISKGHAYEVEGDVYFRVSSFKDYGKLSGRSLDEMLAGARVEVDERKESPMDFALWKKAKAGEPAWDSPWGQGRPGWHIECSVMSMKYLGSSLDIHGGGADLIFPHHENEIAQSEAYSGQAFVRYWLHNGFITVNKEKMSKSLGNFFIVRDILDKFPAPVVRFYLLATHYRSPLDFDDTKLEEAGRALDRLRNTRTLLEETKKTGQDKAASQEEQMLRTLEECRAEFILAMDDDFNTALAISHLFEMARALNSFLASPGVKSAAVLEEAEKIYGQLIEVLGLDLKVSSAGSGIIEEAAQALIGFRAAARQDKDYSSADMVRDIMSRHGIVLEDGKDTSRVKIQNELDLEVFMADIIDLREILRKNKNYTRADSLRDYLGQAGIIIEHTREGVRWKVKN